MTAQRLYETFHRLCPLSNNCAGIKYKAKDGHTIEIKIPGKGTFIFEYYNENKWRFEHL